MTEAESRSLTVLVAATSYPRSPDDWQGVFIRRLAEGMDADPGLRVRLWAPPGPVPGAVERLAGDDAFLSSMAAAGGIAHQLRRRPLSGARYASGLLRRLRRLYRQEPADVLHINWIQNALPLQGLGRRAVIAVLGTDFAMLGLPGMVAAVRRVLRTNRCVLAPNAAWMTPRLEQLFGDLAMVQPVNFGIDARCYAVQGTPVEQPSRWLCVSRITRGKIGHLFDWGEGLFGGQRALHLIGPMQEQLAVPAWLLRQDATDADTLLQDWFPHAKALVTLSVHAEGRPQVMLEAMASGLPVVASALPAHSETVRHGVNGFLVDDQQAFASAVRAIDDPVRQQALGQAARETMRDSFGTWTDCVNRYKQLYAAL